MVEKKEGRKKGRKNLREERREEKLVLQHVYIAYCLHPQYKA